MKKATFAAAVLTALAFSILFFAGCAEPVQGSPASNEVAAPAVPVSMSSAGFAVVEVADASAAIRSGSAIAVDVRSLEQFNAGRISGAMHIPFSQVTMRADELPKNKLIVLYCTCPAEESSGGAAQMLASLGVTNAAALRGGLNAWAQAGLPTQAGS